MELNNPRILIVEDESLICLLLQHVFEKDGFQITYISCALAALETYENNLAEQPFDLVITDLEMPGMDGRNLAQKIHIISPDIPIICMTGNWDYSKSGAAHNDGFILTLEKPEAIDVIRDVVRSILTPHLEPIEGYA